MKEDILTIKKENPDFGHKKISRMLGCSETTVRYHLSATRRAFCVKKAREKQIRHKSELVKLHGGACIKCNYNKCQDALQFHHLDKNTKKFCIGESVSWKRKLEEAKKCILICANCHAEIHAEQNKL